MITEYANDIKKDCKDIVCGFVNQLFKMYTNPNCLKAIECSGYFLAASNICAGGYAIATNDMNLLKESIQNFSLALLGFSAPTRWIRKKLNDGLEEKALEIPN